MKVYSLSQGKVIDTPDAGVASGGAPTTANPITGGANPDAIKSTLLYGALADPKHAATYSTLTQILDKVLPAQPKLTGQSATKVNFAKNILTAAQRAVGGYNPSFTGPIDTLKGSIAQTLNQAPEGYTAFKQNLTDIESQIRNLISGTAVSAEEAKVLRDLIPKKTDSDQVVYDKLVNLQRKALDDIQNQLDTAGIDMRAEDYVKRTIQTPTEKPQPVGEQIANSVKNRLSTDVQGLLALGKANAGLSNPSLVAQKITGKQLVPSSDIPQASDIGPAAQAYGDYSLLTGIGDLIGGAKNLISGGGGGSALLNPTKAAATLRKTTLEEVSKSGKVISGTKYSNFIKDWAKIAEQAFPNQEEKIAKTVKKAAQYAGKEITPEEAYKIYDAAAIAFDKNQELGRTLVANYQGAIRDFLSSELSDLTGGAFKESSKLFAQGYGREAIKNNLTRAALYAGAGGVGTGAGIGITSKFFGR